MAPTYSYTVPFDTVSVEVTGVQMDMNGMDTFSFVIPEDTQLTLTSINFVLNHESIE